MFADCPRVLLDEKLARVVVGRLQGRLHRVRRRFGIDEDATLAGKIDAHIGPDACFVQSDGLLLGKITVCEHAGLLYDVAQLHLAPFPAGGRIAQCGNEGRRLRGEINRSALEFVGSTQERLDLCAQAAGVALSRRLELADEPVELL